MSLIYYKMSHILQLNMETIFQANRCSLHVTQQFHMMYPFSRAVPILSKSSAAGLIIATGSIGKQIDKDVNIYASTDGGWEWREVSRLMHIPSSHSPKV